MTTRQHDWLSVAKQIGAHTCGRGNESLPPILRHSDEGTLTGDSNRLFRCNAARAKAIARQQPRFLVNLVELAGCSINIF
ncbi:hypothetical protein QUA56_04275 [Microcoleus sp. N3A4]|uniref:hypothetical protein n=1 Tax=Microcoleus sp. N3A4 TaxID=3055379 RepID=UPI002FD6E50C